jgi:hypothetical protein
MCMSVCVCVRARECVCVCDRESVYVRARKIQSVLKCNESVPKSDKMLLTR